MSKLLLLTRILLKSGESTLAFSKKKQRNPLLIYLVLGLALLPIAFLIGNIVSDLYEGLASINQEGVVLALGLMAISLMIFFFGIFYVLNIFYFANDIETLLPLPLKPSHILGAKFATVVLYDYFIAAILYLPLVIAFGISSSSGIIYYLYAFILFLVLPVIPLILASVIVMIIMRFTNIAKNKDRTRIIGGIVAIVLAIGGNMAIQYYTQKPMDPMQIQSFFMQKNALVELTTKWFPTSKFPTDALLNATTLTGFANLVLFIGISLILTILFLMLGEAVYFKGVTGVSETTAKRKEFSSTELATLTRQSSPLRSLYLKEMRLLFRTPAYLMNCIISSFILPVILFVVLFFNPSGSMNMVALSGFMNGDLNIGFVLAIVFALTVFFSSSNSIAATAVSREGKNIFISKYLPAPYTTQLWAKALSAVTISLITVAITLAIIIAVLHPPIKLIVFSIVVMALGLLFSNLVGLLFDLYYPKLDWVNEQRAVKGNLNTLFSLLINILVAGATVFLFAQFDLGEWIGFLLITAVLLLLNTASIFVLRKNGANWFQQIEY